jgi:hypothetical protein
MLECDSYNRMKIVQRASQRDIIHPCGNKCGVPLIGVDAVSRPLLVPQNAA